VEERTRLARTNNSRRRECSIGGRSRPCWHC
jgi:hypothetical protein